MYQIELDRAKTNLTDLIEIALRGEDIIITENDKPILKLVRISTAKKSRKAGSAKGLITIANDFDEPLQDFQEYM